MGPEPGPALTRSGVGGGIIASLGGMGNVLLAPPSSPSRLGPRNRAGPGVLLESKMAQHNTETSHRVHHEAKPTDETGSQMILVTFFSFPRRGDAYTLLSARAVVTTYSRLRWIIYGVEGVSHPQGRVIRQGCVLDGWCWAGRSDRKKRSFRLPLLGGTYLSFLLRVISFATQMDRLQALGNFSFFFFLRFFSVWTTFLAPVMRPHRCS